MYPIRKAEKKEKKEAITWKTDAGPSREAFFDFFVNIESVI